MNEFDNFVPTEQIEYVPVKQPLELTVKTADFVHAQGLLIFAALILATIALVDFVGLFMPKEND